MKATRETLRMNQQRPLNCGQLPAVLERTWELHANVRHLLGVLWHAWLRVSSPDATGFSKDLVEQERLRRSRLLSALLPVLVAAIVLVVPSALLLPTVWLAVGILSCCTCACIWLNRRGQVNWAGLLYMAAIDLALTSMFLAQPQGLTNSNLSDFTLFLLAILVASIVLPRPYLMAVAALQVVLVSLLFGVLPHDPLLMREIALHEQGQSSIELTDVYLLLLGVTAIAWLNAWSMQRALRRADRADELEQAHTALALAHASLTTAYQQAEQLARIDPLTGLPNHGSIQERIGQEYERARRYGHCFSLLFFDGDHFKRVNDSYGHAVGDVVLQELGSRVGRHVRGEDTIGRYGGEEFLVLLPETGCEEACAMAERLRKTIAEQPLATSVVHEGIPVTISLGVASYPGDGVSPSEVIELADQAMYWAKRLGRNQVRTAQEAVRLREDEGLVATLANLERGTDGPNDGMTIEEMARVRQLTTIQSLMWLLDLRDKSIFAHSYQVSDFSAGIARELALSEGEVFSITTAALLHDLGKIALPDGLLSKAEALSESERTLMHQHPVLGAQILEVSPFLHHLMPAVHHHHENWDGTGYPDGLHGDAIPLGARIIRVAEAYHAMTTSRPYQCQLSRAEARAELARCEGQEFDPMVTQAALGLLSREVTATSIGA